MEPLYVLIGIQEGIAFRESEQGNRLYEAAHESTRSRVLFLQGEHNYCIVHV